MRHKLIQKAQQVSLPRPSRKIRAGWLVIFWVLFMTACGLVENGPDESFPTEVSSDIDSITDIVHTPTQTVSPVAPPAIATITGPQGAQSFNLLSTEDLAATAAAGSIATSTPVPPPTEDVIVVTLQVPTGTPTPSVTPIPTFTPPSLPQTQPWEHYWLRRPIAEGGTVWTEKAYP